jgi:hypothetical protein
MGTQLDTWQLVDAPPVVPLPYGIFSVAEPRLSTDDHWRLGVQWQSQACSATKVTTGTCIDPEVEPLDKDDYCSVSKYEPFTVYAYNNDDVIGHSIDEHLANTIQRLVATEQRSVEEQLWSMLQAGASSTTTLTTLPQGVALGYLEQILAQNYGGTGVIHMSRLAATFLWEYLEVQGGKLVTKLGTSVVAGAGYDNITTPGDDFTMFASGPVVLYRGDVDTREQALDRAVNQASIIAQRDYVLGWDCVAYGVTTNFIPVIEAR